MKYSWHLQILSTSKNILLVIHKVIKINSGTQKYKLLYKYCSNINQPQTYLKLQNHFNISKTSIFSLRTITFLDLFIFSSLPSTALAVGFLFGPIFHKETAFITSRVTVYATTSREKQSCVEMRVLACLISSLFKLLDQFLPASLAASK